MYQETLATIKSTWNIMVYIVGDHALSSSMISQLKELTDAGFEQDTTVLAFFDPNSNGRRAQLFDVNRQRKIRKLEEGALATIIGDGKDPYVRDIAEDCDAPSIPHLPAALRLRYFLEYARTYRPASNYMLFLMGHGVIVGNDTFLPDPDDSSGGITLSDLSWILRDFGRKSQDDGSVFHLVGFHSCSMNSVELINDLAGSARYMMGTQGSATPGSWPYRQLLKKIFNVLESSKNVEPNEAFDNMLPSLQSLSFYNAEDFWLAGYSSDLAVCSLDPNRVKLVNLRVRQLARVLKSGLDDRATREAIQLAHLKSQSYWAENYTDLYDFCSCLEEQCRDDVPGQFAIKSACGDVKKALRDSNAPLVLCSDYYGPAYQFSYGASIYFPWRSPDALTSVTYQGYRFNEVKNGDGPSWWDFLQDYFNKTRRELRNPLGRVGRDVPDTRFDLGYTREHVAALLRDLSTEEVLTLSPTSLRKYWSRTVLSLIERAANMQAQQTKGANGKGGTLDPPTGKVPGLGTEGTLDPPTGKVPGLGAGSTLDPPTGKFPGLGTGGTLDPPTGKFPGLGTANTLDPPTGKFPGLGVDNFLEPPPGKLPGMGLMGMSVIKNFSTPNDVLLTSRPQGFPVWRKDNSNGGRTPKGR